MSSLLTSVSPDSSSGRQRNYQLPRTKAAQSLGLRGPAFSHFSICHFLEPSYANTASHVVLLSVKELKDLHALEQQLEFSRGTARVPRMHLLGQALVLEEILQ